MTNKSGRPSEYTEELQAKADEYVERYHELTDDVIPSIAGICCYLDIHRSTAYDWRDKHPRFSDTLKKILEEQERTALNKGLIGEFNAAITKLVLHNHGYSDKVDNISSDGSMSSKPVAVVFEPVGDDDKDV